MRAIRLSIVCDQPYIFKEHDFVEICAGFGRLSRVIRFAGYSVESLDIKYWSPWKAAFGKLPDNIGNPLDMCTDSGMACLPLIIYFSANHMQSSCEVVPCVCNPC